VTKEAVETAGFVSAPDAAIVANGPRSVAGGGSRPSSPSSSPLKGPWGGGGGSGGDGNGGGGRNRTVSVGSVGDGGDGGDSTRRTGRQRVAKSFGDEFDQVGRAGDDRRRRGTFRSRWEREGAQFEVGV